MSPLEALAAELGHVAARIDRENGLRISAAISDLKRFSAEIELRFDRLERALNDRIATVKDGASVTVDDVTPMVHSAVERAVSAMPEMVRRAVAEAVAAVPPAAPGRDADPADVAALVRADLDEIVQRRIADIEIPISVVDAEALARAAADAVSAIPAPRDGADADPEVIREMVAKAVAEIPAPRDGETPSMEVIKALVDEAVAALPPAKDGRDVDMAEVRALISDEIGKLPPAKDGETPPAEVIRAVVDEVVVRALAELPPAPAGRDADPEVIRGMVAEAVAQIPAPKDGETPSPEVLRALVDEVVTAAVDAIERPKDGEPGRDADPEMVREMVRQAVDEIPRPRDGADGKDGVLPVVKAWEDRVYYAGEVCTRDGATYQAGCDTGRAPPHDDWTCLAARGQDGVDGRSFTVCGTFDPERDYEALSVVALGGASFVAKHDSPGSCPGEGWQLMSQQGKRGAPGMAVKGDPGPRPIDMTIDGDGMLRLRIADGSVIECDLYPVLSRL